MNILKKANEIVNNRSEEKERQYGDFIKCMEKTARIASEMSSKKITTEDAYNVLIALKLSRQSNNHKEDNLLDAAAYIGSLNNYKSK
jgi:RNase H-fold protein (predicted Holliday junction resolvase)|tara:strand:+ start:507 stop:767 length:261 start_codon:yes stop_codon:yes gene_type:complete